ncbi:catalase-related domain-containing protein [Neobacillus niacini]|uniref:catalase-related domain-containing protein n=1 Tax=Neobacillus niacini TaxID=86668 RepID=UPI0027D90BA3|nr:catalase-related domain-containing protein [Neobacillus niacini]
MFLSLAFHNTIDLQQSDAIPIRRRVFISNLVDALKVCHPDIRNKMIEYFTKADEDYGKRIKEGIAKVGEMEKDIKHTSSAATDVATDKEKRMGHEADPY